MKVLVATGEVHIARLIQVNLERQGQDVLIARDGTEGLMSAVKENPDVIVLDKKLPPIGGLPLISALEENDLTGHARIIVLGEQETGWPDSGPQGQLTYLAKPNDIFKLFAMVES